jgi:hypothetical protein
MNLSLNRIDFSIKYSDRGINVQIFFAKFGVSLDIDFLTHASHPKGVRDLLKIDAMRTFFHRD